MKPNKHKNRNKLDLVNNSLDKMIEEYKTLIKITDRVIIYEKEVIEFYDKAIKRQKSINKTKLQYL